MHTSVTDAVRHLWRWQRHGEYTSFFFTKFQGKFEFPAPPVAFLIAEQCQRTTRSSVVLRGRSTKIREKQHCRVGTTHRHGVLHDTAAVREKESALVAGTSRAAGGRLSTSGRAERGPDWLASSSSDESSPRHGQGEERSRAVGASILARGRSPASSRALLCVCVCSLGLRVCRARGEEPRRR